MASKPDVEMQEVKTTNSDDDMAQRFVTPPQICSDCVLTRFVHVYPRIEKFKKLLDPLSMDRQARIITEGYANF